MWFEPAGQRGIGHTEPPGGRVASLLRIRMTVV